VRLVTETKTRPQNFGSLTVDVVVVVALVARVLSFFFISLLGSSTRLAESGRIGDRSLSLLLRPLQESPRSLVS